MHVINDLQLPTRPHHIPQIYNILWSSCPYSGCSMVFQSLNVFYWKWQTTWSQTQFDENVSARSYNIAVCNMCCVYVRIYTKTIAYTSDGSLTLCTPLNWFVSLYQIGWWTRQPWQCHTQLTCVLICKWQTPFTLRHSSTMRSTWWRSIFAHPLTTWPMQLKHIRRWQGSSSSSDTGSTSTAWCTNTSPPNATVALVIILCPIACKPIFVISNCILISRSVHMFSIFM